MKQTDFDAVFDAAVTEALREDRGLGWPPPASAAETGPPELNEAELKQLEKELADFLVQRSKKY